MTKQEYNGWTNYETWAVALWIDNTEDIQLHWQDRAKEIYEFNGPTTVLSHYENAKYLLADEIKENVTENTPTVNGMYADLLNAAISEVNFNEIAINILDSVEIKKEVQS